MERRFNTTGPCYPDQHYMLPPERRLGGVLELIAENRYFVLQSGRQTGKTTSLFWLEKHLPSLGKRALWLDVETARDNPDPVSAFRTVFHRIQRALRVPHEGLRAATPEQAEEWLRDPDSAICNYLEFLTLQDPRPFALFVDEADCLVGETMVSFLTQLRDGYIARQSSPFPASVALVGMRSVRDFVLDKQQSTAVAWLGTSSPFNISAESIGLTAFTEAEVAELLELHTKATGQRFEPEAVARVAALGEGHPWVTNALADEAVKKQVPDRRSPVTAAHIEGAKETIILERRSHVDSLVARLREPRIVKVLAPMLIGDRTRAGDVLDDDLAYAVGMGILRLKDGQYEIANGIYREVIPRALNFNQQAQIREKTEWYVLPDGGLDMHKLMQGWQKFWRKDGHLAADGFHYKEAGPHLMLMAFLQRIVNGSGRVEREYGLGRGALDLLIEWRGQRHAIEVKLRRDNDTEADALEQLARYIDHAGLSEGWLVLFDLRRELDWSNKLTLRDVAHEGKTIHVVGCEQPVELSSRAPGSRARARTRSYLMPEGITQYPQFQ